MKGIKIIHSGDLHFDTPFKELDKGLSEVSKEEILDVFKKIIDLTIEEEVEVLLLAGDIFDNLTVNKKTLYFIKAQLDRVEKGHIFISPGNHDPYNDKSFYNLIEWPKNVYIFKGEMEEVKIDSLGVSIWGAAFTKSHITKSLITNVDVDKSRINIMVIHGEIGTSGESNKYNPITLDSIRNSGMDYIAIGHKHCYSGINNEGGTYYAYSGCPQGRGFDELGDKGIIIGEVFKGSVDLDFHRTSMRNYYVKNIDVTDCFGYEEIKYRIITNIDENERKNNLYKIVLAGDLDEEFTLDEDIMYNKIKDEFYFVKIKDKTEVKFDIDNIIDDISVKGLFIKKLANRLSIEDNEEEIEILKLAMKIGIQCFNEEEVFIDDN